jgi:hypothetical protein
MKKEKGWWTFPRILWSYVFLDILLSESADPAYSLTVATRSLQS